MVLRPSRWRRSTIFGKVPTREYAWRDRLRVSTRYLNLTSGLEAPQEVEYRKKIGNYAARRSEASSSAYTSGLILALTDLYLLIRWDTRYVTSGIGSI